MREKKLFYKTTLRLTEHQNKELELLSSKLGCSKSDYIRIIINEYLEKRENKKDI